MARVLVVGGGLGGLSCAHALVRAGAPEGVEVLVCEARAQPGGVVGTLERDGFRFETGPHTVLPSAATFRRLCAELGLAERLIPSSERARTRWLWHAGALRALPRHPLGLFTTPLLSRGAKLRLFSEPLRKRAPHPAGASEPSLAELLAERIGAEPTELLAGAFVRGIYGGDVHRLGARSAFPRLWSLIEQHGSLVRGLVARARAARRAPPLPGPSIPRGRLLSLPEGLGGFVSALARSLGPRLRTSARVKNLARSERGFTAELAGGETLAADQLVLAVPAPAARALLEELAERETQALVAGIEHAGLTVVHLGFSGVPEGILPEGFGYLVPPTETGPGTPGVLGTIFASNLFPDRAPGGSCSVACFYRFQDVDPDAPESTARLAASDLARALGWRAAPPLAASAVLAWPDAIPQYTVGHDERMLRLEARLAKDAPGLHLAASWIGGVSVEDVLARGAEIARRVTLALCRAGGGR